MNQWQKILSLLKDFFESSSPADYAKELINVKNPNKNKEIVAKMKNRILDLKDRIKEMSEKKVSVNETLKIIEEILDYNKEVQKTFSIASKVDKSEPKLEETIAKRVRLGREKITEIKEEEENINKELFKKYFTNYWSPSDIYKKLHEAEGTRNHNQVYLIKEVLHTMKKVIKNVSENRKFMIEENAKIIDIIDHILYFNQLDQSRLKILTPNQMLGRLPISLAQLKAGNNSEKLKSKIRQLLYYNKKKLTTQLCKSLIDII